MSNKLNNDFTFILIFSFNEKLNFYFLFWDNKDIRDGKTTDAIAERIPFPALGVEMSLLLVLTLILEFPNFLISFLIGISFFLSLNLLPSSAPAQTPALVGG